MFTKKENITVFISDFKCAYFIDGARLEESLFDAIELPEGVVVNGYVKEPEILYQLILGNFKGHKFKLRKANILIHDQNLLIRNLSISKEELQKKSINQYIHDQTDKKIYFPFEKAAISQFIQNESDETVKVLALITDEDLLHDYCDIFERLGAKEVTFDLPALSLYELYIEQTKTESKHVMLVTLYNKLLAIQIFVNHTPIFQMIEECDGSKSNYPQILENYIERIANYYKYNITKGESSVEDVVIYNLSDSFEDKDIQVGVISHLTDFKAILFDFDKIDGHEKEMPKVCLLPYASLKTKDAQFQFTFEFKLERIKRLSIYGNYLMVAAFTLFTTIALLYIPFYLFSEDITNQQNVNQGLENQLNILRRDLPEVNVYSPEQIAYNQIYESLSEKEKSYEIYLDDLILMLTSEVTINSLDVLASEKTIEITISGTTRLDLEEYVLSIYEAYGISDLETDETRWIALPPTIKVISELVLEVTINHA